jgi:hypothetical protein
MYVCVPIYMPAQCTEGMYPAMRTRMQLHKLQQLQRNLPLIVVFTT